jgi:hypothetical protein
MPDYSARPFAVDRVPLDHIVFANLIQKIQITQFHNAEICWVIKTLVAGNREVSDCLEVVPQW